MKGGGPLLCQEQRRYRKNRWKKELKEDQQSEAEVSSAHRSSRCSEQRGQMVVRLAKAQQQVCFRRSEDELADDCQQKLESHRLEW